MKTRKSIKSSLVLKAYTVDGHVTLHICMPKRWLTALITMIGALCGSVPLIQLLDTLARLPH